MRRQLPCSAAVLDQRPLPTPSACDIVPAFRIAGLYPFMNLPDTSAVRRLQRRFSFVLAAALCLWMLALASHFHVGDYGDDAHQGTHALCAFCVSVPSCGAAPVVVAFAAAPQLHTFLPAAEIASTVIDPAISRYYSRGPPLL